MGEGTTVDFRPIADDLFGALRITPCRCVWVWKQGKHTMIERCSRCLSIERYANAITKACA